MEEKEVMLIGFDIYEFVKGMSNQFLGDSPDMTEGEKKAFNLGKENVLSFLNQTLNEMVVDDTESYNNIAVHVPELNTMTEFADIGEIVKTHFELY